MTITHGSTNNGHGSINSAHHSTDNSYGYIVTGFVPRSSMSRGNIPFQKFRGMNIDEVTSNIIALNCVFNKFGFLSA